MHHLLISLLSLSVCNSKYGAGATFWLWTVKVCAVPYWVSVAAIQSQSNATAFPRFTFRCAASEVWCLLLQDVPADPASGQDFPAGAQPGPSAGAADGQELLLRSGKRHTSNAGGNGAAEADKGKAQHIMSQAGAKVQLFCPTLKD